MREKIGFECKNTQKKDLFLKIYLAYNIRYSMKNRDMDTGLNWDNAFFISRGFYVKTVGDDRRGEKIRKVYCCVSAAIAPNKCGWPLVDYIRKIRRNVSQHPQAWSRYTVMFIDIHMWSLTVDFGFVQAYHHLTISYLFTHLLPHHPLHYPSYSHTFLTMLLPRGRYCSLYVGADEILTARGELFKRQDYESSFLAHYWRGWIDMSSNHHLPSLSPRNHRPSEHKSRHMARGHGRLDSQMHCACACKRLDAIQYTWKASWKEDGTVYLYVCVCVRQRGLIQSDHIHRNRWPTQGVPSLFFFSSGSACRPGSAVQVGRVRNQTGGDTRRCRACMHTNLHFCGWSLSLNSKSTWLGWKKDLCFGFKYLVLLSETRLNNLLKFP